MSNFTETQQAKMDGLREFVNHLEQNPELIDKMGKNTFYIFHRGDDVAEFAKTALMLGTSRKSSDSRYFNVERDFGPLVRIQVTAAHEDVCERVVIGSEEVEVEERDPELVAAAVADIPTVKTVKIVERFEWKCPSSLLEAAK